MPHVRSLRHGTETEQIARWLRDLNIIIPEPAEIAVFPDESDPDDQCWIQPDTPTIDDIAFMVTVMVREADETFPGRRNWRRWKFTRRAAAVLYRLGVVSTVALDVNDADPVGGWRLGRVRFTGRRPYILGCPDWWWMCQRHQRFRIRGRHRPARPFVFNMCAACYPCEACGALYDCNPDCPDL